ncbi:5'/3'-nucleotidase SurE [Rhinocladiella mackenziei CBS 650.93]|uniref:5'/3'-nucleotidase SurE n=1 Tax=Rhinocladiella mackenziei CBS 650.93 TaxID=1442369 RepID=A0A0D2IXM9_9EURO|nr:5'/3'-nucleotidase SurE [Rhinocladiella mackenziei CBS 650.93]KIX08116.1 5'/3'-nucleotidase SurE [Rhinocladiella mackenziei CBS 650.93]
MKFSMLSAAVAVSAFIGSSAALNILMGNDDGFASAQLREFYRLLKGEGHNIVVVAPVDNESGQGGRSVFTNSKTLYYPSEFDIIPAGAPSLGRSPDEPDVWYYNGTPAACTFVALDYVIPNYYDNMTIDLYVGGPNFGSNLGSFLYTLSGTEGGTYAAVGRNIPAIAFSGANSEQRSYTWINQTTPSGYPDPATIQAQLAVDLVNQLVNNPHGSKPLMPLGYGINVNTPYITSLTNDSCVAPPFIQTRIGGGGFTDKAVYNETSGTFTYGNLLTAAINRCINGNCALPGETSVVDGGCYTSVSVFTIDYDAPLGRDQGKLRGMLTPLVKFENPDAKMKIKAREAWTAEQLEARHPLRHE